MPIRTYADLVQAVIQVDPKIELDPFIAAASSLVDIVAANASFSDDLLQQIETWLSAHIYTIRDPRTTSERAGPVSASYQSAVALGLNTSHYGQMAMILDTSGTLRGLSLGRKKAQVTWLGEPRRKSCC